MKMKYFTSLLKKVVPFVIPVFVIVGVYMVIPSLTTFAQFPAPPALITVTKSGIGTGKVVSDKYGVNCGAECWISVENPPHPLKVTLTATPDAGSVFSGWYRYFVVNGSTTPLFVSSSTSQLFSNDIIDACFEICVNARFDKIPTLYKLTINKPGTGLGIVQSNPPGVYCKGDATSCNHDFLSGTSVTLYAYSSADAVFNGWTGGCTGTSTSCTVTMNAAKMVTATFTKNPINGCPAGSKLSAASWTDLYPGSKSTATLSSILGFRQNTDRFIAALRNAGVTNIDIQATYRPPQRAYLMYYSWRIAKGLVDPRNVPSGTGIGICWVHKNANGTVNLAASRAAAQQMVNAYGTITQPALASNHITGNAIDMIFSWTGTLNIKNASGATVSITTTPKTHMNPKLWEVSASYKVIKYGAYPGGRPSDDAVHWSTDGH